MDSNISSNLEQEKNLTIHTVEEEERLALNILHKLRHCPEDIETRPLFNSLQPFIEQGRLELFVDIFLNLLVRLNLLLSLHRENHNRKLIIIFYHIVSLYNLKYK
jgi:hypothetical protein